MGKPVGRMVRGLGLGMLRETQKRTEIRQEERQPCTQKKDPPDAKEGKRAGSWKGEAGIM